MRSSNPKRERGAWRTSCAKEWLKARLKAGHVALEQSKDCGASEGEGRAVRAAQSGAGGSEAYAR